jgi:hypothetical protein
MPKKDFDFIFKILLICAVFLSAWNYIFFCFPKIARAEIINAPNWNKTPLDNKNFTWYSMGWDNFIFQKYDVGIDENGYSYWIEKDLNYNHLSFEIKLYPFDTPQYNLTQGAGAGEKLWIASELYGYVENGLHYTDNSGIERTSGFEGFVNNFSVAGTTIYLKKWTGIGNYDEPFHNFWIETPHIAGRVYFIVYTNQDLSFINSQSTLYTYLNSLNQNATTSPQVYGIDPVSGSEVSDLFTNLKIGYKNLNFDEIDGLIISFVNDAGINSELNAVLDKTILDPSGSGITNISLKSFEFQTKEKWNLQAFGFKTRGDIIKQNWIATDNLVLDPYFLNITDPTLKTPFTFTDPADWYALNVTRYASSTAFFSSFVGLISPVFETVGNFAVGIKDIFNTDQAYQTGYTFGAVLPLINGYIDRIDSFFGGFPLGTIFKYCIYVLIAMFIIRLIFKFIPFFG